MKRNSDEGEIEKLKFAKDLYVMYHNWLSSSMITFGEMNFFKIAIANAKNSKNQSFTDAYDRLKNFLKPKGIQIEQHFYCAQYIRMVSEFELFLTKFIIRILLSYPQKIENETIPLHDAISLKSKDSITEYVARKYLNQIMYKKPDEYLEEMCRIISFDKRLIKKEWDKYILAKAQRDLGVHNNWVTNDIYIKKTKNANFRDIGAKNGKKVYPVIQQLIELDITTNTLAKTITNHSIKKFCGEKVFEKLEIE